MKSSSRLRPNRHARRAPGSKDFFEAVLGFVAGFVVDVDIGALDVGQALELDLEGLGDVVGIAQRLVRGHDDVDFDDDARPAVVSANGVEGEDLGGVGHCCEWQKVSAMR